MKEESVSWIVAILVGALIGWMASRVMGTDAQQGALANIVVGIAGSLLAKWLFADVLGIGGAASAGSLSLGGVLWGLVGAVLLIWVARALGLFRR